MTNTPTTKDGDTMTNKTLLHAACYNAISGTTRGKIVRPAVAQRAASAGFTAWIDTPDGPQLMARCYLCGLWGAVEFFALDHVDPATKREPGVYLEDLALACTPCNSRKRDTAADYPY